MAYVIQTQACSVPNSATPPTPQQLKASQAMFSQMNTQVLNALAAFTQLVNRPDLNAAGQPTNGGQPVVSSSGQPAGPMQTLPFDPGPVPPASAVERLQAFPTMCQGNSVAPAQFTDPKPCYGEGSEAPPMPSLISPPVGPRPMRKKQAQCGSNCWAWIVGGGIAVWFLAGASGGNR